MGLCKMVCWCKIETLVCKYHKGLVVWLAKNLKVTRWWLALQTSIPKSLKDIKHDVSKLKEPCEISRIPVASSNYQLSWVLGVRINCYCAAGGRCWTGSDYKTNIQIKKKNAASPRLTDRHPQPSAILLSLRWPLGQLENFIKQPPTGGIIFRCLLLFRGNLQTLFAGKWAFPFPFTCIFCHRNATAGRYWELDHHPLHQADSCHILINCFQFFSGSSLIIRFNCFQLTFLWIQEATSPLSDQKLLQSDTEEHESSLPLPCQKH